MRRCWFPTKVQYLIKCARCCRGNLDCHRRRCLRRRHPHPHLAYRRLACRLLACCRLARSHCHAAGWPATAAAAAAAAADHESIMIKSFDSCEVGNGGGGWCILHPVGISIFVHAHFLRKNEKRHCFSQYTTFKLLQLLSIFRANTLLSTLASQNNTQWDENTFEFEF